MVWIYLGNKNGREGGRKLKKEEEKEFSTKSYRKQDGGVLSILYQ